MIRSNKLISSVLARTASRYYRPILTPFLSSEASTSTSTSASACISSIQLRLHSSYTNLNPNANPTTATTPSSRSLSTVVEDHTDSEDEDDNEGDHDALLEISPSSIDQEQQQQPSDVQDLTFGREKAGTPSPWAVFDAWGAGADIPERLLSPSEQAILQQDAVKIPLTADESSEVPSESEILEAYDKFLQQKSSVHLGYPYNLMYDHSELYSFMKYSINNLGDPWVPSNYGVHSRQFECAVIDFFASLWKMEKDSYWGYVTTSGTEGNLHGILLARENHPDGILYTSNESHYSVFKAARYYRMDCRSIPTLPMGEINYDLLAEELDQNREHHAILNVNIGTTVKGAVDDLDRIIDILQQLEIPRDRYHIHCDGALFALMMPFLEEGPEISFRKPIDSIAVSGHKMLGCPMPCGIALSRKEHVEKVEQHIDYLNSVDTTIMGSRNGQAALYMWYSLRKKGLSGIKRDVTHCMETARYLRDKLTDAGFSCRLNDLSSTVVLERPVDDAFVKRWQLACEEDIAHVVVMPNITPHKIDVFVDELCQSRQTFGRTKPLHENSSLSNLGCATWGGTPPIRPQE